MATMITTTATADPTSTHTSDPTGSATSAKAFTVASASMVAPVAPVAPVGPVGPVGPAAVSPAGGSSSSCSSTSQAPLRARRLLEALGATRTSARHLIERLRPAPRRAARTDDDGDMIFDIPGLDARLQSSFRTVAREDVAFALPPERQEAMHYAETVWRAKQRMLDPRLARYSARVTLDELDLVIRVLHGSFRLQADPPLSLADALDWLLVVYHAVANAREAKRPSPVELPYIWIHPLDLDDLDRQMMLATQQGLAEIAADADATADQEAGCQLARDDAHPETAEPVHEVVAASAR